MRESRTATEALNFVTRVLSILSTEVAQAVRNTDAENASGPLAEFKRGLLHLEHQVSRFLRPEDVQRHRRRAHRRG